MNKITKADKKILEQFPKYDNKPEHWVGSRDYWESIFETETNRDPKLHEAFSELHEKIVNMVIQFCEEHELKNVDEFCVSANGLVDNYGWHVWAPCTDSAMTMTIAKENENGWIINDRENPFLHEI